MQKPSAKSHGKRPIVFGIVLTITALASGFLTYCFAAKIGIFKLPGVVNYDASLTEAEITTLKTIFTEEVVLAQDLTISVQETLTKPDLAPNQVLVNIFVPVTNFYTTKTSVASADYFVDGHLRQCNCGVTWIDFDDLDFTQTLLAVDDHYYLDTLNQGAIYRYLTFESATYETEVAPLIEGHYTKTFPTQDDVLTFAQTGVTALSRGMHTKLQQQGYDGTYFAQGVKDFLSGFDLTHTSNEASFTEAASSKNICSNPHFFDTLLDIGLDIVELTGNHNNDCGFEAANSTIDLYRAQNIQIVGGGKTAAEAAVPLEIAQKGTNLTFLAYNQSTGGATYGDYPGANQYYEEDAAAKISAAKAKGDFVIVDVQFYECNAYNSAAEDTTCDWANSSAGDQIGFFRHLIDLGADLVVGTSAHQAQTYELYGKGVIYYGLGNLFFDQVWWPGTTRSLILAHYFRNGKLLQTKIIPTVYDETMQTRLVGAETRAWLLERLMAARPAQSEPAQSE